MTNAAAVEISVLMAAPAGAHLPAAATAAPARCQRRRARPGPASAPPANGGAAQGPHHTAAPRPDLAYSDRLGPHWRRRARGGATSATAGGHWSAAGAGPCLFCWRRGGAWGRGPAATSAVPRNHHQNRSDRPDTVQHQRTARGLLTATPRVSTRPAASPAPRPAAPVICSR